MHTRDTMRDAKGAATNHGPWHIRSGLQLRCTKGHTEALAPQDHAAECAGVGAVGHSVMGVAPVGAQAAEVYVVAVRKLSRGESGMTDRRIAEPDMQSWPQSGTQIFQPQNLCSVP